MLDPPQGLSEKSEVVRGRSDPERSTFRGIRRGDPGRLAKVSPAGGNERGEGVDTIEPKRNGCIPLDRRAVGQRGEISPAEACHVGSHTARLHERTREREGCEKGRGRYHVVVR